jgi:hypothetical protein
MPKASAAPKETASGERGVLGHAGGPTDRGKNGLTPASNRGRQRRRTSKHISKRQAMNLIAALEFATVMGCPLNVSVDISWLFFSGSVDDRTRFARCKERLSKWAKRRGFPLPMIWTREVGINGGINTHVLLHAAPWFMDNGDFQRALERAFEPEGGPNHAKAVKIQPAHFPQGKLNYILKGVVPQDAKGLGVRASYQGDLVGKRAGCTESISTRARKRHQLGK